MAEGGDKGAAAKGGGGSKLVPALLVVNLLLVAAVLGLFLVKGGAGAAGGGQAAGGAQAEGKPGEPGKDGPPAPGPTAKLADFVVHLRNPDADRYARLSFEIEVATEEDKNRLAAFTPRVRDGFIAYLSDRTFEELRGSEAITRTKQALEERLAQMAPGVTVRGVYVTDLVIQ
jgi:flagellar FliL protein